MNTNIKITDFKKKYKEHVVKLNDLTISGRVSLIVGENGSGKSTLLKAIAYFISFDGEILNGKKTSFMSEVASYPHDIDLNTFLSNLNKISKNPATEKTISELLKSFNLDSKKTAKLHNLSKGMKAKVNIVQCLMEESDIYLLDEPLSGLDKEGVDCLVDHIIKSKKKFVISTHLVNDFESISDEIYYL